MRHWRLKITEPSLDDLLDDEMMAPVMRSAKLDRGELRRFLIELAGRVPADPVTPRCGCSPAREHRPSAA